MLTSTFYCICIKSIGFILINITLLLLLLLYFHLIVLQCRP